MADFGNYQGGGGGGRGRGRGGRGGRGRGGRGRGRGRGRGHASSSNFGVGAAAGIKRNALEEASSVFMADASAATPSVSYGSSGGGGGNSKQRRQERKARRTELQAAARSEKLAKEARYYFQGVERALALAAGGGTHGEQWPSVREVFGVVSGTAGLNFKQYHDLPVQRSGSGHEAYPVFERFRDVPGIGGFLQENLIERCRYDRPTPVQANSVPVALSGRDVMCCAQTGSGKTCAFLLPIFARHLIPDRRSLRSPSGAAQPQALVMAPTRELALQIHGEARKLSYGSPFRTVVVYGGAPLGPQLNELSKGVDLLVVTPGRLIDLMERGIVSMSKCTYLCLDEADRMLDMGFVPQLRRIVQRADMPPPGDRQTLMFSATFPHEVQSMARDFMTDYIWVAIGRVGSTVETITQSVVETRSRKKEAPLFTALQSVPGTTLVFVAKKKTAGWLFHRLRESGITSTAIHGDRTQRERENALADFKSGKARVLVATDVAARGLDISGIKHVINYDMPGNIEDYVHRIGRTGRAGHSGHATSFFVTEGEPRWNDTGLAKALLVLLRENGQTVPPFLAALHKEKGGGGGGGGKRKGGGGGGSSFGGQDVRFIQGGVAPPRGSYDLAAHAHARSDGGGGGGGSGRHGGRGGGHGRGRGRGRGGRRGGGGGRGGGQYS